MANKKNIFFSFFFKYLLIISPMLSYKIAPVKIHLLLIPTVSLTYKKMNNIYYAQL